jgi:selenocysteine-specific elongation factor
VAMSGTVMTQTDFAGLGARLAEGLGAFHAENPDLPGMGLERLRATVAPAMRAPVFRAMLRALARAGVLALDGAWVRQAGHETRLSEADEAVWRACRLHLLGAARFRPPRVRDLVPLTGATEPELRRVLKRVARTGEAHEVAHDHFFLRPVLAEIAAILVELARATPDGTFAAADLRDRLDNGRKVAIQVLEFFDHHGVTLRHGDRRRLDARRLDLFLPPVEDPAPSGTEEMRPPVGRPDFKSGEGRQPVLGGFDSHSPPPARLHPRKVG